MDIIIIDKGCGLDVHKGAAGDKRIRLDCPLPFKVSLNMLRFHQILRPNESFQTSLLFSPISLIPRY
jgi:hypothetical protein